MMDSLKIGNGLPVIGQGTDIGISSLPVVGYLGKNCDSAKVTSDEYCPACREKGKLKALKTYRISFQESIFLCEDLQCIYPLGFKSLNNLISPDLEESYIPSKAQKRKILETSCKESPLLANSKKTRSHIVGEQSLSSKDLLQSDQQSPVRAADSLEQNEILETDMFDLAAKEEVPSPVAASGTRGTSPQNEGGTPELEMPLESKRPFGQTLYVQWKNAYALCWLDCILSAVVHLEGLKSTVAELCSKEESVIWRLFTKYNQANGLLCTSRLDGVKDGDCKKLTSEIFAKIETSLNEVRDEIFIRLQPQLRCTLGDMESPVFAFPLLLKIEPRVEKLFMYSFSWNFECSLCGHKYQNRCVKNLVTFTNVVPEWHPLNAAHFGPCNNCSSKSQIRKMVLEKLAPVFMLHFVEGLPHNDLQQYSFHFRGSPYQITSIIQYQANNHFITWNLGADGCWLECDDLKGLCSERHEKFEVPASEIHVVIWERKTSQMADKAAACLPLKKTNDQHAFDGGTPASPASFAMGEPSSTGTSSATCAPRGSHASNAPPQNEAEAHGDHLLSGPEGLADSHFITLTLEEIQVNPEGLLTEDKPVGENKGVVTTNTLQSEEPPVASLVSALHKEELIQDQIADFSLPSPVVGTNTQSAQLNTEGAAAAMSVTSIRAPDLIRGITSMEVEGAVVPEKDTRLRQFLSPQTETLTPEQHVASQEVSNLTKENVADSQVTTAKALQSQSLKESQKKPFVGSWVKGLLSRGASFMPPCVSAQKRNTVTDLQFSVKGARNFGGFKTKVVNPKANRVSRKSLRCKRPPVSDAPPSNASSHSTASHLHAGMSAESGVLEKCKSTSYGAHLSHNSHGNGNGVSSENHGDSVDGQIHKLRLKLLKKLKAKKKKLAALMSSPQNGPLPSENLENTSHCGSPNDCESIEDLLNELQYQIDIADNKSGSTTVSSVSLYTNQTHEEILAELLSPTTLVSTELPENRDADFRYLEMGDNHVPAPIPGESNSSPPNLHLSQDHNYCSPTKKNHCDVQADPLTNNSCTRALNLESSTKTDIFDEFFSTSELNSLANDTLDLPHFDEYLFETC